MKIQSLAAITFLSGVTLVACGEKPSEKNEVSEPELETIESKVSYLFAYSSAAQMKEAGARHE